MKLTDEQKNSVINLVLQEWIVDARLRLESELKRAGKHVPRETMDNLHFELLKASAGRVGRVLLSFQDSGRHVDMRQLDFDKAPITRDQNFILEWVKKQGRSRFRYVPGYKNRSGGVLSEEKQLQRIAAAIIKSKKGTTKKRRRKARWFNRNLYQEIGKLTAILAREQVEYVARAMREDISEAFKQR
ncbi:MAG: hypothetical protein AAFP92_31385 [Bacteroidota bacterium]